MNVNKRRARIGLNHYLIAACAAMLLLLGIVAKLWPESLTIMTSYPSPTGIYRNLVTTGQTTLARDGGAVGIGTPNPSSCALLDLTSPGKGLLMPRMSTAQRNAIASPQAGLLVFNTMTRVLEFFDGSVWGAVGGFSATVNYPARALGNPNVNGAKNRLVLATATHSATISVGGQNIGCYTGNFNFSCTATALIAPGAAYTLNSGGTLQGVIEADF